MIAGSLRLRLFLAGVVSIALALALAAVGLRALFERHAERSLVAEMTIVIDTLTAGLDGGPDGGIVVAAPPRDARFERPLSGYYWQIGPSSAPAALRSRSLWDTELALPPDELSEGALHTHRVAGPAGHPLIVVERLVTPPARLGAERQRVAVGRDVADLARAAAAFTTDLAPFLGLIGLLLLAAAAAQVGIGLAPLKAVRARLAVVRSGRAARLGGSFPNEVKPLALEVDALLDQRERDIAAAHARAADLAHGLKTPLQVLFGEAGRLRRAGHAEAADSLEEIGAAMRRHIERELGRARRAGRSGGEAAVVREVADQIVRVLRRTPHGRALDWQIEIDAGARATIHPDDLAEALGAVMENAARFARTEVRVSATVASGMVDLAVVDDGPGMPAEMQAEAVRRGGRLDESAPGTGLGLAIASDILEAWHGRLVLGPTRTGAMTVSLVLPAARPVALTDR